MVQDAGVRARTALKKGLGGCAAVSRRGQVRVLVDARVAVSRPCRRAGVGRRVRLLRGLSSCGQADGEGCESGSLVCVVFGLGLSRSRSVLCTGTLGGWCLGVGRDAERRSQQLQLQLSYSCFGRVTRMRSRLACVARRTPAARILSFLKGILLPWTLTRLFQRVTSSSISGGWHGPPFCATPSIVPQTE